jgi:hypothetical protein
MKLLKHFKAPLSLSLIVALMVVCTGCPYESNYPLDGTKVKYDKKLLGYWVNEDETELKISRIDDYTFSYIYNDHDDTQGVGMINGTGYAVANGGSIYIVGKKDEDGKATYFIYKIEKIQADEIEINPLDEDHMGSKKTFSSSKEFNEMVKNSGSLFPSYASTSFVRNNKQNTTYDASKKTNTTTTNKTTTNNTNNTTTTTTAASGSILFSENFDDNKNKWYTNYDFKDSNYIYVSTLINPDNHFYYFANRTVGSYIVPFPYTMPSDYNYSIQLKLLHYNDAYKVDNSPYGLKFAVKDWKNCYNLDITETGYYRISKYKDDVYSVLTPWTKTDVLKPTVYNKVEVRVYSSSCSVFINDKYITSIDNFSSFGPYAGLEVHEKQTIYFDDLIIKKL